MPPRKIDRSMWCLRAARTLAWALMLGGWVGLGSLSQALAPGPLSAFALQALWLLAIGGFAELIGRLRWQRRLLRALLLCAALISAQALSVSLYGGAPVALLLALLAWALIIALASAVVRACRAAVRDRAGPPVGAAATGAVLAWVIVGDITDLNALVVRLMLGALAACPLLVVLLAPHTGAISGCRAGLFDCSLPDWSAGGWRVPQRWPVLLASFVMLPMMCSLPLMVGLCANGTVRPQAVLAVHFAAMFAPSLLMVHRAAVTAAAPRICAALLALGALILLLAPGPWAWWGLVLAHGAAWSVAWAAQLDDRAGRKSTRSSPLLGATLNALLALTLGLAVAMAGLQALTAGSIALGVAGALAALAGPIWRARALHPG